MSRIPEREPIPPWMHKKARLYGRHCWLFWFGATKKSLTNHSFSTRGSLRNKFDTIEKKKILGGRRAQVSAAKVNAATHEMWEAVGLRN